MVMKTPGIPGITTAIGTEMIPTGISVYRAS